MTAQQVVSKSILSAPGAYGCRVVEATMSPAYEPGDVLLIHPGRPVRAGDDVLISRLLDDGGRQAIVRRLIRVTAKTWRVRRFNPPDALTLDRTEWPTAELIVGKYSR